MLKKRILTSLFVIGCAFLFGQNAFSAPYADGTLVTSPKHPSVYEIQNGKRRGFFNATVYYTWYSDFKAVKTLTVEEIEAIELGTPMPIKENTKLLKFPLNPKVYAVMANETIQHIPDEATAVSLFGANWATKVIELPEIYFLFYTKGPALEKSFPTYGEIYSMLTVEIDETCHPTTKEYINTTYGFRFCYPKEGEVKSENGVIKFGAVAGGTLNGVISIVENELSLEDYRDSIPGATKGGNGYNELGVEYISYSISAEGGNDYALILHNEKTNQVIDFVYAFATSDQKKFVDTIQKKFKFTEVGANTIHPYIKHVGVGKCEIKSGLARFARNVPFGDVVLPEKYEFCYTHDWDMQIQNTSNNLYFMIPPKGTKKMSGYFGMDYFASTAENRIAELKVTPGATNLVSGKTAAGDTIISYNENSGIVTAYNIEIIGSANWIDKEETVRVAYSFGGDTSDYATELAAFKTNLTDTFSFIK